MGALKEGMCFEMRLNLSGTFQKVKLEPRLLIVGGFSTREKTFTEVYYCWCKSCRVFSHTEKCC